ncbi:MAG: aryl-sulfate sulfotransferase [Bryobacterales bacterium]|nr:aryl-sulfate sulfotransferase [Bryobacterales bacterium]
MTERIASRTRRVLAAAIASCAVLIAGPAFETEPSIRANPNLAVPLAAIVAFEASEPVMTTLAVSDGEREWTLEYPAERDPAGGLPVVGMKYGRTHRISVRIAGPTGEAALAKSELQFSTPEEPDDPTRIPPVRVMVSEPEKMEPGYSVLSLRRVLPRLSGQRRRRMGANFGLLAAIDHQGEIVWSYQSDSRISDVEPLSNGNFLFVTTDNRATEIDVLGNRVGHWYAANRPQGEADGIPIPTLTMHHEIDELANGNLLVMGTELREYDDWFSSETDPAAPRTRQSVMGDVVIEFTRTGEVVWEWKALDHLDPYRIGYETFTNYWINRGFPGARDWSHGNGFFHDARDDSLLISFRMQDAVVKIDRRTNEIVWILGDHGGWPPRLQPKLLTPEGEMGWFYHQHMPQITSSGTLLLFDNRTFSARPFAPPLPPAQTWTRAVEYEINEAAGTVRQLWASQGPATDRLMTFAMGEADAMPITGNVLLFYGSAAVVTDSSLTWEQVLAPGGSTDRGTRIREFTRTNPSEIVWDIDIYDHSDNQVRWGIYGGARIAQFGSGTER